MPHAIIGPTGFGGAQTVMRSGTTAANIRLLIDTRGFVDAPHATQLGGATAQGLLQLPTIQNQGSTFDWKGVIKDAIDAGIGRWFPDDRMEDFSLVPQQPPINDNPLIPNIIEGFFEDTLPRGAKPYVNLADGTVGCISGYHPEKSGRGYCVRNRRMNALNPRALSRASRRVGGFARAVKRARTLKKICRSL